MAKEVKLKHDLFGYNTVVREGDKVITLKRQTVTELDLGMKVVLLGDSRGYVPSGFNPGQKVTILEFSEPFSNSRTDHIIKVSDGSHEGWVKPSNIEITKYHSRHVQKRMLI
jgi:hypothetical protein